MNSQWSTRNPVKAGLRYWKAAAGLGLLVWLANASPGLAYFQDLGMGVRPAGMGEAFAAVADDSNAMFFNIAGIAGLDARELNLMYSNLYANLNARLYTGQNDSLGYHNVGLVFPFDEQIGSFGFTWTRFESQIYRENSFVVGYAREIGRDVFDWFNASERVREIRLDAGMNLKILNWMVDANDYTTETANPVLARNGLSRTGFTADLGLLAAWTPDVKFGLSLENFIPADVGVTQYETIPINFRFGVSYLHDWLGSLDYVDSLLGTMDFTQRNGISDFRVGAEGWFFKRFLALRLGTTADQFSTGLSVNAMMNNSPIDLQVDYAFGYPYGIQSTWGSHRVSLIVRWANLEKNAPVVGLETEENMAKVRDQELSAARAQEEAKLRDLMRELRTEIKAVMRALGEIETRIKNGELPPIQFEAGKAVLKKNSLKTLDAIGEVMESHPLIKVRIEGHTDSAGAAETNLNLSRTRVEKVQEYLLALFQLKSGNLIPMGYGETRPIADNQTPEGRAANRRVDIKVLLPAGMDSRKVAPRPQGAEELVTEPISAEDIVPYENVDNLRQRLKVYEMQVNPDEVEELFKQQREENGQPPVPQK